MIGWFVIIILVIFMVSAAVASVMSFKAFTNIDGFAKDSFAQKRLVISFSITLVMATLLITIVRRL